MRRRRPRGETVIPLPKLPRELSRREWLAAMREWADAHAEGGDRWANAHAALAEIEAFGYTYEKATDLVTVVAEASTE